MGNRHPSIVPYETFEAMDGFFNLAVGNDAQFRKLCEVLGEPGLADDARYATNPSRVEHRESLHTTLSARFKDRSVKAWLEVLERAGIPAGSISDVATALAHPQLHARGMVATMEHPVAGALRVLGTPLKVEGAKGAPTFAPPPALGEHTAQVLTELCGVTEDALETLCRERVAHALPGSR
jgi:formyl-CoA transferase/CoA:oxalate CoA-transferase